jgi:hypothetical protein
MTDHDLIRRLLNEAATELMSAADGPIMSDAVALNDLLSNALKEANALPTDRVEEAFDVKGLHDRIHVCLVQIRATRHALDVIELGLDSALENVRRVGRMVEPEDDGDL